MSESSFVEQFESSRNMLLHTALRILKHPQDAEDCVQNAFVCAWRTRHSFRGDCRLSTWLITITTRQALEMLRKDKRRCRQQHVELPDENVLESGEVSPHRQAIGNQLMARIRKQLRNSPKGTLAVLLQHYYGYGPCELARLFGVDESTMKARCHKGRLRLREVLS